MLESINQPRGPLFLRVADAANFLRVSVSTIHRWVHRGEIPYYKFGGRLVFSLDDLVEWTNRQRHSSDPT